MLDLTVRGHGGAEAAAPGEAPERHATAPGLALPLHGFGLAVRVLAVTIGFVFLAMGLFYVTRLAAHREMWLHSKIGWAQTSVEAFGLAGPTPPSQELSQKILRSMQVKWLAVETPTGRREFVLDGGPPAIAESITAEDSSYFDDMAATFRALFTRPGTIVKLSAPAQGSEPAIEFAFDEQPLIHSLRRVSAQFPRDFADHRRRRHLRAVGGAVAHGAVAGAPAHIQHHRLRRESAGRRAGDDAFRAGQRDRPRRGRARRHAALARARAGARQAPRRTRHGGRAHQPRPAQHAQRRPAHFRSSGGHPRSARPTARAASGRHARSGDPVLPGDPDLWRGARTSPLAPALRLERTGGAGRRSRRQPKTTPRSTTTSTFRRGFASTPTRTIRCACSRT